MIRCMLSNGFTSLLKRRGRGGARETQKTRRGGCNGGAQRPPCRGSRSDRSQEARYYRAPLALRTKPLKIGSEAWNTRNGSPLSKARRKPAPVGPFAEVFELSLRFLAKPFECWKIGSEQARAMMPKLAFSAPLEVTRETGCLNSEKSSVFSMLEGMCMSRKKVVPPGRLELPLPCGKQILSLPRLPVPPQGHAGP